MMMYGNSFYWIGGLVMMLFWVLVLAGIIWGVVYFSRRAGQPSLTAAGSGSPLEVLRRRFAAGEINEEQFEEMKRTLSA